MSFLAPLFLLGIAAVAAPIVFHLIRRTTKDRTQFSSLMFLQATPPRVTRRSKLENLWLLLLRCLVLLLLALGFARPFLQDAAPDDNSDGPGKYIAVLIDTSASMRRDELWKEAKEKAAAILEDALPGDHVALLGFDRTLQPLVTFDQWSTLPPETRVDQAVERLDRIGPGWSGTELGDSMIRTAEMIDDIAGRGESDVIDGARRIVVISDFTQGSRLTGLQGYEWPGNIELVLEPVETDQLTNAGLQPVAQSSTASDADAATRRVRISNAAVSSSEQFKVGWARAGQAGFVGDPVEVYVPPGQSRVLKVPDQPADGAGGHLLLQGDASDFDNRAFLATQDPRKLSILYVGDEAAANPREPLYYVTRAFQETRSESIQVNAVPNGGAITSNQLAQAALLIVTDALEQATIERAETFLESGKIVLLMMRTAESARAVARLAKVPALGSVEATIDDYAMLGQIDFQHPILTPFSDPRFSDFTKIHFWKYRKLETNQIPGAQVLASYDSGDPAWLEVPAGEGTLFVFTSGWQPGDSQLALSSKFVPLLYSILAQTGRLQMQTALYRVGEEVRVNLEGEGDATITKPDASQVSAAKGERFMDTDLPGVYTITALGSTQSFAVNLPEEESNTAPLPREELERLGVPLTSTAKIPPAELERRKEKIRSAELENRQKLWRWLIVAALVVLLMETWIAGLLTRRAATPA